MNVSNKILDRILSDQKFRLGLAIAIGVSERQVQIFANNTKRGVSVRLRDHLAVKFYVEKGYSEDEIFETEESHEITTK